MESYAIIVMDDGVTMLTFLHTSIEQLAPGFLGTVREENLVL